ncbi:MAG TPA: phosphatase PAP2 family protein, partial [Bacillales bacterium]
IFQRQRPEIHRLIEVTGYSFPSGHAMGSFVFYGMLGYFFILFLKSEYLKAGSTLLMAGLIFMIGFSRVYLGVHYPSDVLAGFAAGGAWLTICIIGLKVVVMNLEKH